MKIHTIYSKTTINYKLVVLVDAGKPVRLTESLGSCDGIVSQSHARLYLGCLHFGEELLQIEYC